MIKNLFIYKFRTGMSKILAKNFRKSKFKVRPDVQFFFVWWFKIWALHLECVSTRINDKKFAVFKTATDFVLLHNHFTESVLQDKTLPKLYEQMFCFIRCQNKRKVWTKVGL